MKRVALLGTLALLAAPVVASAQIGFGAAAGASIPMNNLSNGYEMGYHAQASLNISPPLSPLGFRVDAAVDNFSAKTVGTGASAVTGSLNILSLSGNVILGLGAVPLIGPYVLAGAGLYNDKFTSKTGSGPETSSSGTDPGVNVGAGVRFGLGSLGASAEVGYHLIHSSNSNFGFAPIMFSVSF